MSCDDIADCIDTSEAVQNAITNNENINLSNLMETANSGLTYPSVDAETDTIFTVPQAIGAAKDTDIKVLEHCNLDALWAGIRDGIVQRLDDNARSVLEWLVSKADVAARGTALVGAIPIFGSMAKALLDQMVELAPDMLNLFEAYSSIEHMDEIACEIFGIVCAECRYPTFTEVFDYYASYGITGIGDLDDIVIATATDLLFGSTELLALAFYHTIIAYELIVLFFGSKFYGFTGSDALVTMASLGEDFANDNWEVLCDSCDDNYAYVEWDFIEAQGSSYMTSGYASGAAGVYIPSKGWKPNNLNATDALLTIGIVFDPAWRVRNIAFKTNNDVVSALDVRLRPTISLTTGSTGVSVNTAATGWTARSGTLASLTGFNEFALKIAPTIASMTYLTKVGIIFDKGYAPSGAIPTPNINFPV